MNFVGRRTFLEQLSLASGAMALPLYGFSSGSRSNEFVEVETTYGRIKGGRNEGVSVFKGVPYAGCVSGFRRLAPLDPWTGVRDALQVGPPAIQSPRRDGSAPKESFFGGNRPERFTASRHFAELWTTFTRTGTPAASDVPV